MKNLLRSFVSLCQLSRCWKVSSGFTFLVRGFQGLCVRMLFYYVYEVLSFCFNQRSFMDLFHIFRSSGISGYFQVLSFCLSEGFKVSESCFIIFRCSLSVFYQRSCMDILVNIFRSSCIWVCLSRFCCQRFSNCQSVCQRYWSVYCQRFSTVNLLKMLKCFLRPHVFCLSEDFMV